MEKGGNDIDVYLKPLIEDLLLLWKEEGVRMWDAHAEEHFNLRALLFVTTNNWAALSNLSDHSNKDYKTCTHCLEETDSTYLKLWRNHPKLLGPGALIFVAKQL